MENSTLLKATHFGKINIGGKELSCAVLEDGTRILTNTAIFQAFDRPRKGKSLTDRRNENVPSFVDANNLKPFVDKVFGSGPNLEIKYIGKNKSILSGYRSEILPLICEVYLEARDAGVLSDNQKQLAVVSDILMRSFAKIGITALIDEATGYQYEREQNELQKIFEKYISKEFLPWTKVFPDEFYIQMFRLRGWDYKGRAKTPYAGRLTNYLVYERLPEGVLDELKRLNPVVSEKGYRKHRLHQRLSKEQGYVHLERHIAAIIIMMKGFDAWEEFDRVFRKSFDIKIDLTDELIE